jgi:hypothetical protein
MGFVDCFCEDSIGKAGGLALFWKLGVDLEVVFSNKYAIVTLIYSDPPDCVWLLIVVHGPLYLAKKQKFWNLMSKIINSFAGVWLMLGDLNCIAGSSEKK